MTTHQDSTVRNNHEINPGANNTNWNLRDALVTVDTYAEAHRRGFIGTEEEWERFLNDVEEHDPQRLPTHEVEPAAPVEQAPLVDGVINRASRKASDLCRTYRMGPVAHTALLLSVSLLLLLGAFALMAHDIYTSEVTRGRFEVTDQCGLDKDGLQLTGTRTRSYMDHHALGYHWYSDSSLVARTVINAPMNGLTVVAITDGTSETIRRDQAVGGIMILPKADYYTFFSNGKATGATYDELCH